MAAQEHRYVARPGAEFVCRDAWRIVLRVLEDAENFASQVLGDRLSHAHEPAHEEIDRAFPVQAEGGTSAISRVSPRVEMVQPD